MAGSFSAYSTTSFAASSNTTKQYSTAKGTLVVTRSIRAGEELFVDKTRQPGGGLIHYHAAYVQELPLAQDYEVVDAMVQAIAQEGYYDTLTPAQFHDLLHRLAVEIIPAGNGGGSGGDSRRHPTTTSTILQQLFPRSQREFQRCLKEGSAKYRLLTRNLNELEQEGMWRWRTRSFYTYFPLTQVAYCMDRSLYGYHYSPAEYDTWCGARGLFHSFFTTRLYCFSSSFGHHYQWPHGHACPLYRGDGT